MFCDCLHDNNNKRSHTNKNDVTSYSSSSIINYNLAVAESFLSELTFWEPSIRFQQQHQCHYLYDTIMSPLDQTTTQDYHVEPTQSTSAAAACLWKAAVDPTTKQTYYYHTVTRETQWEKPSEIRAMEKQARKERRRRDRIFFREMEQNIYASLARGELIPPSKKQIKNDESAQKTKSDGRVRTISGMDNVLLAQLQKPKTIAMRESSGSGSRPPVQGRPPRPNHSRQGANNNINSNDDSLDISSDESTGGGVGGFSLRESNNERLAGEYLLDGPIEEQVRLEGAAIPKPVHLRRNTGGTIFVKSTMTAPNIEATIKCVCGVFRAHILQSASKQNRQELGSPPSVTALADSHVFYDDYGSSRPITNRKKLPSLEEICTFYQEFYNNSQMEHDTIIMSLIYVERLIKEASISPDRNNWMSVLFSCMVLASKVWDDLSMWNIDFSHVCGKRQNKKAFSAFTLGRINQLELALLKSLHFNVKVPASEYAKYYFLIRSMLIKSGLLDEVVSDEKQHNVPLDMQGAKNLETLSSNYQETFIARQEMHTSSSKGRRSKSMDGYFWFSHHSSPEQDAQPAESRQPSAVTNQPCGNGAVGPVLKQSVCLEQLVTM